MSGYFIESKPLTPDAAKEIIRLMSSITISASSAGEMLAIMASVERIATGVDTVQENTPED